MSYAGHITAETTSSVVMAARTVTSRMEAIVVVMMMVVMPVVVAVCPVWIPAPVTIVRITPVAIVRIAPVVVPTPIIAAPVRTIAPTYIIARVVIPVEGVIIVHVNVGVTTASVIIIVIA